MRYFPKRLGITMCDLLSLLVFCSLLREGYKILERGGVLVAVNLYPTLTLLMKSLYLISVKVK